MDFKKSRIIIFLIFFIYLPSSIFSVTISDAASLMEKKEYQKSIEILDSLITDNPEYAIAHLYRGYAYMMLEKYENALSDYKKADEISSTVDSLLGIQWALLASGKNDESIEVGKKILEIDPNSYYGKQRIADAYLEKKEYEIRLCTQSPPRSIKKCKLSMEKMQTYFGKLVFVNIILEIRTRQRNFFRKEINLRRNIKASSIRYRMRKAVTLILLLFLNILLIILKVLIF